MLEAMGDPVMDAFEAAAALQPRLNAFISLMAMDEGRGTSGERVPYAVKDLIATAGVRTTAGSRILADWVPRRDATIVTALREAGYVAVGKTNTHEFAFGTTNDNPHYGATRNPWAPHLTTGGSSGGSAAIVAAGAVPLALGTDTAGSVRIPAALCGCVGFKPGWNVLPTGGVVPLARSLDTVGFLSASVADSARAFAAVMGGAPEPPAGSLAGISVGVPEAQVFERVHPGIVADVEGALRVLERLGARIRRVSVPVLAEAGEIGMGVSRPEAFAFHARWFPARRDEYGPDLQRSLDAAATIPASDYLAARERRRALARTVRRLLREVDLLAGPTVPVTAFENRVAFEPVLEGGELPRNALTRLTYPWSLARLPAISVPCGLVDGLPAGLQLAAAAHRESFLVAAAAAYERARGPWPPPPVSVSRV
jgi:aspartyl-tRNA(Asn)/glutamyl-tRNA(Gln) amidotransferase subunit A